MRTLPFVVLALFAAAFAGCTAPESEDGSASIYVKDAPTDEFTEIHVVFTEVRVHAAGTGDDDDDEEEAEPFSDDDGADNETDNETDDETDEGLGAGWHVVFENADGVDIDLLDAAGTRAAFLGEASLDVGRYTQIRIVVAQAYGIGSDGNRTNFTIPNSPLKIIQPFDVEEGQESRIIIDVDLDRSLKQQGGDDGEWRLSPVIGTTKVEIVDDQLSGEDAHTEGEVVDVAA